MGFLIDAVATWFSVSVVRSETEAVLYTNDYLAELNHHTEYADASASPVLSLVVWTLKREVRASGECLGMYRR